MPASKKRSYARYTLAAVGLLGTLVEVERKSRRMTASDLAQRLGVTRSTLARLERGDPKVELGLAFEACALFAITLFDEDAKGLGQRTQDANRLVAILPKYARPLQSAIQDDF